MRELIAVETRLDPDGGLRPQAFHWRGCRYVVHSHGRRWEQAGQHHFLVQDARMRTFELALETDQGYWTLLRGPSDFGGRRPENAA